MQKALLNTTGWATTPRPAVSRVRPRRWAWVAPPTGEDGQMNVSRPPPVAPRRRKPAIDHDVGRSMNSKSPTPPRQSGLSNAEAVTDCVVWVTVADDSGQEKRRKVVVLSSWPQYIVVVAPS